MAITPNGGLSGVAVLAGANAKDAVAPTRE
jgi:hypothetical protein